MCYKDMTFCRWWRDCAKGCDCRRRLTDEVLIAAAAAGLPVAQFSERPGCHEEAGHAG